MPAATTHIRDDLELIVTHPGKAHRDDFMTVSYLLSRCPGIAVERRAPLERELHNPLVAVVDVGGAFIPDLNNYDHHQARDIGCSLSLVLQAENRYQLARRIWEWLEPTEIFDTHGPKGLTRWLRYESSRRLMAIFSPIEKRFIDMFATCRRLEPGHFLHSAMLEIGHAMTRELELAEQRLKVLEFHAQYEEIEGVGGFRSTLEDAGDMPGVLEAFVDRHFPETGVVISNDIYGIGWLLFARPHQNVLLNFLPCSGTLPFVMQVGLESGIWCKTTMPLDKPSLTQLLHTATMSSCP